VTSKDKPLFISSRLCPRIIDPFIPTRVKSNIVNKILSPLISFVNASQEPSFHST
jgi:hypothetical protein